MNSMSLLSSVPKRGDIRADGYLYVGKHNGKELWSSPEAYHARKVLNVLYSTRKRANARSIAHNLTTDYLRSIFPSDSKCPVLGIPMTWGQHDTRNTSPSLDRITPERGYVEGNVCWISLQANRLKNNATLQEMEAIVAYMRNPPIHGQKPN